MYGLIIEELRKYKYIPRLKELINALESANKYNWLLSSYDVNYPELPKQSFLGGGFTWLTGETLTESLKKDPHFIWCVATAYNKNILLDDVLQHPLPFADGYGGFWTPELTMQNPLSEIEIVIWHGYQVLIFSKSKEVIDKFAGAYPNAEDLREYNSR